MYISIEEMLEKSSPAKVITKVPKKKGVTLPKLSPLYEFEFYKKDFITKNKKYFCFYDEKCIFFKVTHIFSSFFIN